MGTMHYKPLDRVKIKSLDWYNRHTNGTEVDCGAYPFTSDMKEFCGQERIIANVCQECYFLLGIDGKYVFTDEMIEGLVEEETKPEPKFKVDDTVKWYNHTCIITSIDTNENTYTYLIKHDDYREDKIFAKWVPEIELTVEDGEETKSIDFTIKATDTKGKVEVVIPEGYGYVVENDRLYFITKKKEYPKTYEECCEILQYNKYLKIYPPFNVDIPNYDALHLFDLLEALRKLLICRDAYWKIAGEEMGLGRPWEPDWDDDEWPDMYYISFDGKHIDKEKGYPCCNMILIFPTAEMRDAFYKVFKEEIEICKELL